MVKNLIPWKKKSEELTQTRNADHPFEVLHQQMNDLFENFFEGFGPGVKERASSSPTCEVSETDKEVRVRAELPGMDEKDIEVILDENVLTIRGEKKEESEEKKRNYYVSEVHYGHFSRSVPLPTGIDKEKAKAKFKRGVLTLTLPKSEQAAAQRKQIPIQTESE